MRTVNKYCGLMIALILFAGCRQKLAPDEYIRYIQNEENGLKRTITTNDIVYIIQYRTPDCIALAENPEVTNPALHKARVSALAGIVCFNISIKRPDNAVSPLKFGIASREEYEQRLQYYLIEAVRDIWLVHGTSDTLYPAAYHFENNYGLTPQETMVVSFRLRDKSSEAEKLQLCYRDRIFKNGIIKAAFSCRTLKNLPKLTISE